eukprot:4403167-Amphidinium_carterae.1
MSQATPPSRNPSNKSCYRFNGSNGNRPTCNARTGIPKGGPTQPDPFEPHAMSKESYASAKSP